jgi:hypothetical protein
MKIRVGSADQKPLLNGNTPLLLSRQSSVRADQISADKSHDENDEHE